MARILGTRTANVIYSVAVAVRRIAVLSGDIVVQYVELLRASVGAKIVVYVIDISKLKIAIYVCVSRRYAVVAPRVIKIPEFHFCVGKRMDMAIHSCAVVSSALRSARAVVVVDSVASAFKRIPISEYLPHSTRACCRTLRARIAIAVTLIAAIRSAAISLTAFSPTWPPLVVTALACAPCSPTSTRL